MKKYYIGFAVLMAVVLASFVYAISQASAAKADRETNQAVEDISSKLDSYASSSGVPASLAAADVKNAPDTVKYTKLSGTQYKLCVSYKTAASGFDAGWTGLFLGGLSGGSDGSGGSDNSYFNPAVETNHKKGSNCQTITPYVYDDSRAYSSSANSGVYTNCDNYSDMYQARRTAKIKSVDTTNRIIYLDSTYVQNYEDGSGFLQNTTSPTSMTYNSNTSFYDNACQKVTISSLMPGDRADFYVGSTADTFAGQVEIVATGASVVTQ